MPSEVSIYNMALTLLGEDGTLLSPDDDVKAARVIKAIYADTRDAMLRAHPWNFASTRVALPALAEAPVFGFANAYALPADWLRFCDQDEDNVPPWRLVVEGRTILTDAPPPLNIVYVRRIEDPTQFDALFVTALAAKIAVQVAQTLSASDGRADGAMKALTMALNDAKKVDGQENPNIERPQDDWLIAREAVNYLPPRGLV